MWTWTQDSGLLLPSYIPVLSWRPRQTHSPWPPPSLRKRVRRGQSGSPGSLRTHFSLALISSSLVLLFLSAQQSRSIGRSAALNRGLPAMNTKLPPWDCPPCAWSDSFTHPRLAAAPYDHQRLPSCQSLGLMSGLASLGSAPTSSSSRSFLPSLFHIWTPSILDTRRGSFRLVTSACPCHPAWGPPPKSDCVYPSATCKCIKTPDLALSGHQTLKAQRLSNYEQTRTLLKREGDLLIIRWGKQAQNKMIWVNQGVDSLTGQLPPS